MIYYMKLKKDPFEAIRSGEKIYELRLFDVKRKQIKDGEILCLLQYIFSKQKQNRAIPFPIILLCYGSNSGVGSCTFIISRDANRNPFVNACSSCRSQFLHPFFNLSERNLLLFCENGSEFRFKPHNGYKRSAFVCAACYTLHCFFQRMSALMQS